MGHLEKIKSNQAIYVGLVSFINVHKKLKQKFNS